MIEFEVCPGDAIPLSFAKEMRRDITIPVSAVLLVITITILSVYESTAEMPLSGRITKETPEWQLVTLGVLVVSMLRLFILWWQTLFDAIRPADQSESRSGWIISHFIFGFITPYFYYYCHRAGHVPIFAEPTEAEIRERFNAEPNE